MTEAPKREVAVAAGRGVLFITAAKLWFILAGYLVIFVLPRLLSAAGYGAYSQVTGLVSMFNNVLITGTIQAVSRFSTEDEERAPSVLRSALRIQLVLGLLVAGAYFGAAPWIANSFLRKPSLTPLLWTSAVIVLAYSIYAALVGSLNGRKLFHKQAALDVSFSTLRTALTIGLAAAGMGAGGAIGGFAGASVAILAIAIGWVGLGRSGTGVRAADYLGFVAPLYVYHLLLNGILLFDANLLSRASSLTLEAAGVAVPVAETQALAQVGYYRAAQNLAFIPYQLILSVAFVVFPLVSQATFEKDAEATRAYVKGALRFSLLVCACVASIFAARASGMLALLYPQGYGEGTTALAVLAGGVVAFSLFVLVCTILNGAGRARATTLLAGAAFVAMILGNLVLVSGHEGRAALTRTAIATSGAMAFGLVLGATVLWRSVRAFVPLATGVRVIVASGAVFAAGRLLPATGKVATLGVLAALFVLYVGVLAVLREFGAEDFAKVRKIVRGR